eukprot:GHVU01215702.1.p1 GENE.GHVU01215702.1~~GHVU01215702.1.p1  ORF type:complete len:815 (+),score=85.92 GHVU01215702.1:715-3159(+)
MQPPLLFICLLLPLLLLPRRWLSLLVCPSIGHNRDHNNARLSTASAMPPSSAHRAAVDATVPRRQPSSASSAAADVASSDSWTGKAAVGTMSHEDNAASASVGATREAGGRINSMLRLQSSSSTAATGEATRETTSNTADETQTQFSDESDGGGRSVAGSRRSSTASTRRVLASSFAPPGGSGGGASTTAHPGSRRRSGDRRASSSYPDAASSTTMSLTGMMHRALSSEAPIQLCLKDEGVTSELPVSRIPAWHPNLYVLSELVERGGGGGVDRGPLGRHNSQQQQGAEESSAAASAAAGSAGAAGRSKSRFVVSWEKSPAKPHRGSGGGGRINLIVNERFSMLIFGNGTVRSVSLEGLLSCVNTIPGLREVSIPVQFSALPRVPDLAVFSCVQSASHDEESLRTHGMLLTCLPATGGVQPLCRYRWRSVQLAPIRGQYQAKETSPLEVTLLVQLLIPLEVLKRATHCSARILLQGKGRIVHHSLRCSLGAFSLVDKHRVIQWAILVKQRKKNNDPEPLPAGSLLPMRPVDGVEPEGVEDGEEKKAQSSGQSPLEGRNDLSRLSSANAAEKSVEVWLFGAITFAAVRGRRPRLRGVGGNGIMSTGSGVSRLTGQPGASQPTLASGVAAGSIPAGLEMGRGFLVQQNTRGLEVVEDLRAEREEEGTGEQEGLSAASSSSGEYDENGSEASESDNDDAGASDIADEQERVGKGGGGSGGGGEGVVLDGSSATGGNGHRGESRCKCPKRPLELPIPVQVPSGLRDPPLSSATSNVCENKKAFGAAVPESIRVAANGSHEGAFSSPAVLLLLRRLLLF